MTQEKRHVPTDAERTDDYHFRGMHSAYVVEWCGGRKAEDSSLFELSVAALLARGMTEDQITAGYRERFQQ